MEAELLALMGGRRVDLRTPQDLSRYFREKVLRTAEVQFAQQRSGTHSPHGRRSRIGEAIREGSAAFGFG